MLEMRQGEVRSLPRATPPVVSGARPAFRTEPPAGGGFNLAATLYPEIGHWAGVLDRLALSRAARLHAAIRARIHGVTFPRYRDRLATVCHEASR